MSFRKHFFVSLTMMLALLSLSAAAQETESAIVNGANEAEREQCQHHG
jgi:hypothetical protein